MSIEVVCCEGCSGGGLRESLYIRSRYEGTTAINGLGVCLELHSADRSAKRCKTGGRFLARQLGACLCSGAYRGDVHERRSCVSASEVVPGADTKQRDLLQGAKGALSTAEYASVHRHRRQRWAASSEAGQTRQHSLRMSQSESRVSSSRGQTCTIPPHLYLMIPLRWPYR